MSKFAIGDKVKNTRTGEIGYIIEVYPPRRGRQLYKVKYKDRENDEASSSLTPDIDLSDPFERCRENYFSHYTEYLKGNTAFKIRSSNNSTISSLKASRTLFRPYQFKPLLKFLNSDDHRLLIADEVGLGKTIEAGHIMLELKARGELHNVLVICPMSLKRKWATEFADKFGLDFIEIGDKDELIMELQHHNGNVTHKVSERDGEFPTGAVISGTVKAKKGDIYVVELLDGRKVEIPVDIWNTKISLVGKIMKLKKTGFNTQNMKTRWKLINITLK